MTLRAFVPTAAPRDALDRWRRRGMVCQALGTLTVVLSLAWVLWPLGDRPDPDWTVPTINERSSPEPREDRGSHWNGAAFAQTTLWNPPPTPAGNRSDPDASGAANANHDARTPPRLVLVAIIDLGSGGLAAAMYDPEADEMLILREGDRAHHLRVESIGPTNVTLHDGRRSTTLSIRKAETRS